MLCCLSFGMSAQSLPKDAELAFTKGDAKLLLPSLSDEVSLSLVDLKKKVSADEAIKELEVLLRAVAVVSFEMKHSSIRDESAYIIGSLITEKGKYRVNCFYKKENNQFYIHQIRIDKANE